ncbi:MAG: hypothetical protein ACR2NV_06980, partial [Thermoleophilaceae bacterium]
MHIGGGKPPLQRLVEQRVGSDLCREGAEGVHGPGQLGEVDRRPLGEAREVAVAAELLVQRLPVRERQQGVHAASLERRQRVGQGVDRVVVPNPAAGGEAPGLSDQRAGGDGKLRA